MGGKVGSAEIMGLKPSAYPMRRVTALLLGFRLLARLDLAGTDAFGIAGEFTLSTHCCRLRGAAPEQLRIARRGYSPRRLFISGFENAYQRSAAPIPKRNEHRRAMEKAPAMVSVPSDRI